MPQVIPLQTLQLPLAFDTSGNTTFGELYQGGAETLTRSRGPREGLFVYRFEYVTPSGLARSRLGIVGRVHANPNRPESVRLIQNAIPGTVEAAVTRLGKGARQSEPVVVAFDDLNFELERRIESVLPNGAASQAECEDESGRHSFWRIGDERRIESLRDFFADRACIVIDGDTEFRAFRKLRDSAANPGDRGAAKGTDAPSPLTLFVNLFDFGVQLGAQSLVLRELSGFDVNGFVAALHPFFLTKTYAFGEKVSILTAFEKFREELRLLGFTDTAFGALFKDIHQFFIFQLRTGMSRRQLFLPDVTELECGFDSVLIQRAILNRYVKVDGSDPADGRGMEFLRSHDSCVQEVISGDAAAAFFSNPPNKRRLLQVAREGQRLPPGSVCLNPPLPPSLFE